MTVNILLFVPVVLLHRMWTCVYKLFDFEEKRTACCYSSNVLVKLKIRTTPTIQETSRANLEAELSFKKCFCKVASNVHNMYCMIFGRHCTSPSLLWLPERSLNWVTPYFALPCSFSWIFLAFPKFSWKILWRFLYSIQETKTVWTEASWGIDIASCSKSVFVARKISIKSNKYTVISIYNIWQIYWIKCRPLGNGGKKQNFCQYFFVVGGVSMGRLSTGVPGRGLSTCTGRQWRGGEGGAETIQRSLWQLNLSMQLHSISTVPSLSAI